MAAPSTSSSLLSFWVGIKHHHHFGSRRKTQKLFRKLHHHRHHTRHPYPFPHLSPESIFKSRKKNTNPLSQICVIYSKTYIITTTFSRPLPEEAAAACSLRYRRRRRRPVRSDLRRSVIGKGAAAQSSSFRWDAVVILAALEISGGGERNSGEREREGGERVREGVCLCCSTMRKMERLKEGDGVGGCILFYSFNLKLRQILKKIKKEIIEGKIVFLHLSGTVRVEKNKRGTVRVNF